MGIRDYIKNLFVQKNTISILPKKSAFVAEVAKGQTTQTTKSYWDKKYGEKHPHDMDSLNQIYKEVPIIHGGINKITDFTVGPGFKVITDNDQATKVLTEFMHALDFDNLLRTVVRHILIYGNAYLEVVTENGLITQLVPRDPSTIFVKRDPQGNIIGYTQLPNKIQKPIDFSPEEIIHFKNNNSSDSAYGMSIIYPILQVIHRKIQMERDMQLIVERKAGAPYVVKVGDEEHHPSQDDINSVRQDLEVLRNDHEWVVGPLINIEALGFKDKVIELTPYLEHDENQIVYGMEVPLVLLGRGNIPEGLAKSQQDAFERKIISLQLLLESVLENNLLQQVLQAHNLTKIVIEFEWQQPSEEDRNNEITHLTTLIQTGQFGALSPEFMQHVEQRLADLLQFKDFTAKTHVPVPKPIPFSPNESINPALYDAPLKEYAGRDYTEFLAEILSFIDSKKFLIRNYQGFKFVPGTSQSEWEEVLIKYSLRENLTKKQVGKLREVLKDAFQNGQSLRTIKESIKTKISPTDLNVRIPEVRDDDGEISRHAYTLRINSDQRSWSLARTETMRAMNQGSLSTYDKLGIKKVQWLASNDERTCPYCGDQHNSILTIDEANERIPAHDMCRCTWLAITE